MSAKPVFLPLPLDRILNLALRIEERKPLKAKDRADISRALFFYLAELEAQLAAAKRGRRFARETWECAFAAQVLVERYNVPLKRALAELLPHGTAKDMDRVETAYRKLADNDEARPSIIGVEQRTIDAALARLKRKHRT